MKLLLTVFFTWVLFILNVSKTPVNGQYFDDPNRFFKKFEFDRVLRGSFNISYCLRNLINCMELLRPEIICSQGRYHLSACAVIREDCHDVHKEIDSYRHRMQIEMKHCLSAEQAQFS